MTLLIHDTKGELTLWMLGIAFLIIIIAVILYIVLQFFGVDFKNPAHFP